MATYPIRPEVAHRADSLMPRIAMEDGLDESLRLCGTLTIDWGRETFWEDRQRAILTFSALIDKSDKKFLKAARTGQLFKSELWVWVAKRRTFKGFIRNVEVEEYNHRYFIAKCVAVDITALLDDRYFDWGHRVEAQANRLDVVEQVFAEKSRGLYKAIRFNDDIRNNRDVSFPTGVDNPMPNGSTYSEWLDAMLNSRHGSIWHYNFHTETIEASAPPIISLDGTLSENGTNPKFTWWQDGAISAADDSFVIPMSADKLTGKLGMRFTPEDRITQFRILRHDWASTNTSEEIFKLDADAKRSIDLHSNLIGYHREFQGNVLELVRYISVAPRYYPISYHVGTTAPADQGIEKMWLSPWESARYIFLSGAKVVDWIQRSISWLTYENYNVVGGPAYAPLHALRDTSSPFVTPIGGSMRWNSQKGWISELNVIPAAVKNLGRLVNWSDIPQTAQFQRYSGNWQDYLRLKKEP